VEGAGVARSATMPECADAVQAAKMRWIDADALETVHTDYALEALDKQDQTSLLNLERRPTTLQRVGIGYTKES